MGRGRLEEGRGVRVDVILHVAEELARRALENALEGSADLEADVDGELGVAVGDELGVDAQGFGVDVPDRFGVDGRSGGCGIRVCADEGGRQGSLPVGHGGEEGDVLPRKVAACRELAEGFGVLGQDQVERRFGQDGIVVDELGEVVAVQPRAGTGFQAEGVLPGVGEADGGVAADLGRAGG